MISATGKATSGFTMVELLITVVIIAVCQTIALRVFSICAATTSEAYNNTIATNVLRDKINMLKEKSILENGVEVSSTSEEIAVGDRKIIFTQNITEKDAPAEEAAEEAEGEEAIETAPGTELCEAELAAEWGRAKAIRLKAILPLAGSDHES